MTMRCAPHATGPVGTADVGVDGWVLVLHRLVDAGPESLAAETAGV
jgi:hypothetical protein